jgi:hypothetical protein
MGLAYNDATGDLWVQQPDGSVLGIDTGTGGVLGGWPSGFTPPSGAGLTGVHDGTGHLAAIGGSPDQAGIYDTFGNFAAGPWTLSGGPHYGIAVVPEPAMWLLLVVATGTARRR